MKLKWEDLHNSRNFELIETVDYTSLLAFVRDYMKPRVSVMRAFYAFLVLTTVVFGYFFARLFIETDEKVVALVAKSIIAAFVFMVPVIPVHELLHGIAFKLMGAKKLIFGVNWKEMVFYVTVDKFVLDRKQFYFLALTPFAVLSLALFPLLFSSNPFIAWLGSLFLLIHTMCCIGDFALMAYFSKGKGVEIYTYDDVSTKISYFFRKID